MYWRLIPVVAFLALALPAGAKPSASFDVGFLASRHQDAHGDTRLKIAGPFFEMAQSTQGWRLVAIRPFYSEAEDPAGGRALEDYFWPLATWRKNGAEESSRYLVFFQFKHGEPKPDQRYRFWLLPFYFEGRDASGATYRAVFPFGGTIKEFLGRDEISFVLFPIRSTSKLNDLETSNWLWPIISTTKGEGVHRHRVFPLYGRSTREGAYDKRFILWPIYTEATYFYPGSSGSGFLLVPIYGHMKLENQESWWVLPPFFRYVKGNKATRLVAPWPFIQWETGETERLYFWPLYGRKKVGNYDRTFVVWPIFWREHNERANEQRDAWMMIPFYFHSRVAEQGQPPKKRYVKLWPLFSYRRDGDESKFRMLELWPIADHGAVERNWAPLWTVYSTVRVGENVDREFLWGLYRDQRRSDRARRWTLFPVWDWAREADRTEWSFLEGLIGRERTGSAVRWRMLYFITFGDEPEEESEP